MPEFSSPPEQIKEYVRSLHESDEPIDQQEMDTLLLGMPSVEAEKTMWRQISNSRYADMTPQHPTERAWRGESEAIWTPYAMARTIKRDIHLNESDTFYDLGAGYGRLVLYFGIIAAAACKGIEMVGDRVRIVQDAIDRLQIENAEFIESKVQDVDYSDGDVFYIYSPFTSETFEHVFDRLEEIAADKPITVISRGGQVFGAQQRGRLKDLTLVREGRHGNFTKLFYYESADIAFTPDSRVNPLDN